MLVALLSVASRVSSLCISAGPLCLTTSGTCVACTEVQSDQASQAIAACGNLAASAVGQVASTVGHVPFEQQIQGALLVCAGSFVAAQLGRGTDAKTVASAADQTA